MAATWEDIKHDLLLIIVAALFIRFSAGIGTAPAPAPVIAPPV